MRCVKETLPPRARARWLLMTVRLSQSSFTGTERTEVAVGTERDSSMFLTVRAAAPRSTTCLGSSLAAAGAGGFDSFGTGLLVPLAGSAALALGRGLATGEGFSAVFSAGFSAFFCAGLGAACSVGCPDGFCSDFSGADTAPLAPPFAWKYFAQVGSTLPGSFWYWSYISSTSHSLAPKSAEGCSGDWLPEDCGTGCFASSGCACCDGPFSRQG